ncbi:MAG TPA: hypothetical protein VLC09_20990, partial [Polyangiaceae bacterium]|nr:hypothetical protein [Polyangiaceae bacterium]
GAEVQQPLATVVVIGMFVGTALTLAVLPGVMRMTLNGYEPYQYGEREEIENEYPERRSLVPDRRTVNPAE